MSHGFRGTVMRRFVVVQTEATAGSADLGLGTHRMSHTVRRLMGLTGSAMLTGVLAVTTTGAVAGTAWTSAPRLSGTLHSSIVVARPGHLADAAAAVRASGGKVGKPLAIVNGFTASVSSGAATRLSGSSSVVSVTPDSRLTSASNSYDSSVPGATYPASARATSLWPWNQGGGIGVAVLDTGVTPVPDLRDHLFAGIDLSGEGNSLQTRTATAPSWPASSPATARVGRRPTGVAPKARIWSVKVAGANGVTDVSQVLAAMQWIVTFGRPTASGWSTWPGAPTRRVSASTPSTSPSSGLGRASSSSPRPATAGPAPRRSPSPATTRRHHRRRVRRQRHTDAGDDAMLDFSSRGPTADGAAKPDLVAPGRSLIAPVDPSSTVAQNNPQALVDGAYIRGSGTSQATAVTAAGVALLLAASRGHWTPDQVKYALTSTAHGISGAGSQVQGAGEIRINRAQGASVGNAPVQTLQALGTGTLEGSRGDQHVSVICNGDTTPT